MHFKEELNFYLPPLTGGGSQLVKLETAVIFYFFYLPRTMYTHNTTWCNMPLRSKRLKTIIYSFALDSSAPGHEWGTGPDHHLDNFNSLMPNELHSYHTVT